MPETSSRRAARAIARAESVGSFLRPAAITAQMNKIYEGQTTAARPLVLPEKAAELAELNKLADAASIDLIERQIAAGLDVVNDGELRRTIFLAPFWDALEGVHAAETTDQVLDADGNIVWEGLSDPVVSPKVHKVSNPLAEEVTFMRGATDYPWKVTIPAASYWFSNIPKLELGDGYARQEEFVADALEITRKTVAEAVAAGAKWIQFDFPTYPTITDPALAEWVSALGETPQSLLEKCIAVDNEVLVDIPEDVTVAMHLCRGNLPGGIWQGHLDPIAEQMFSELNYDRYLFEWEDVQREGSYEPIKYLPKGKIISMGLISTKTAELESADDIKARLDEASKFLDLDQLALCPQCGFASLFHDSAVQAEDAQWRKLDLVGSIADDVWGR